MILLAAAWMLWVQPNPVTDSRDGVEFAVEQVDFNSLADCEIYARQQFKTLLTLKRYRGKPVVFPEGTVATYTCRQAE